MLIFHTLSADHRVQISGHAKGYHYVREYFHNSVSTAIFCIITQRVLVISYCISGQSVSPTFKARGGTTYR